MKAPRRVAITGLGALAAPGSDVPSLWRNLCADDAAAAGSLGTGITPRSATQAWPQAAVQGFVPAEHFDDRVLPMLDRVSQFALVAARQAMAQAGMASPAQADIDPTRAGAVFSAGLGHGTLDDAYLSLYGRGADRLHPLLIPRAMPSAGASQLSMHFGLQGPTLATASACASSAHAIGLAFHFVRSGMLDMALAGGAEASLVPGMVKAWAALRVLSPDTCRPFSLDRSGMVLGEGAAVLVLEDWQQALRRGAQPLAELAGFGMSADAGDMTAPDPAGAARAMRAALEDAGCSAAEVDYVNAHGTGTRLNDRCESAALALVYGPRAARLPMSSIKGRTGHTLNAAGALEALVTVLALRDGLLPPTANFRQADPECPVDWVGGTAQPQGTPMPPHHPPSLSPPPRPQAIRLAMSNSFAFGGLNAALLLRAAHS